VQRVELGLGVQGQGQAELGLGGQGVLGRLSDHTSESFLATHRSHCSKMLSSATAPQPLLPSKINIYLTTAPIKKQ